ncbi:NERD domain-containing protein [Rossellomorea vietnamensis]|uniref:NERD domain-containing protein n=1 Tax=Rossellomorea vietnamensis TaxID=218284 RepID=A0A5D4M8A3_9BACI|nr:NERD domain-containing protein [Rossellomorea vietnamensis]TYR97751.1 NERD domain-containing protein [Rossellomorea vietnamensis]
MLILFSLLVIGAAVLGLPQVKGRIGEGWVKFFLSKLDPERYFLLHDILLPGHNGKTTQIDHIVVSPYGIFVIETKNYNGWIFGSEKSKKWTQQIYRNKQQFQNPIHQNHGHIEAIKNVLGEQVKLPYVSIIAFNSRADLKKITISSPDIHVTYDTRIKKTIELYQDKRNSTPYAKAVHDHLKSAAIEGKEAVKSHVTQIKKDQKQIKLKVHNNVCPKCDGKLLERRGRHGRFKGCSNYPKCRYTA